ncbi:helix-turn-helix domain-containing protein [Luedemannella flava]
MLDPRPIFITKIVGIPWTVIDDRNRIDYKTKTNENGGEMNEQNAREAANLGAHVKQLRQSHGLSVRQQAARAGVDATWLSRVERGVYTSRSKTAMAAGPSP